MKVNRGYDDKAAQDLDNTWPRGLGNGFLGAGLPLSAHSATPAPPALVLAQADGEGMAILAGFEFMPERLAVASDAGDREDEHSCFSEPYTLRKPAYVTAFVIGLICDALAVHWNAICRCGKQELLASW